MNRTSIVRAAALTLLVLVPAPFAQAAPTHTQTFSLHPGWNSIYLEVAPTAADPATVFAAVPLLSVWTWNPKTTSAEFIQNPSEEAFGRAGWLGYFPPGPFAALTNLFSVQANRAYLVRISGSTNVTLTVTGRPSVAATNWVPSSLNLVGFHVDPAAPPTFASFLASSPAHAGQAIYRLGLDGIWAPLPASTPIESGEAYWVFCSGASSFTSPAFVELAQGDGLDYAQSLSEQTLTVRNLSTAATASLSFTGTAPLTYWRISPTTNEPEWAPFPSPLSLSVAALDSASARVGVQRAALAGNIGEGVMQMKDGRGTRILIPVSVQKLVGVSELLLTPPGEAPPAGNQKGLPMPTDLRRRTDS